MPVVDIKGVGKAQFPDDMPIADIRTFLRNKYFQDEAQGVSRALDPAPQSVSPYEPSLAERAGTAIGEGLKSSGLVSDTYGAQRIGRNVSVLGEMLPGIGDATAGDDTGRALAEGRYGDAALSSLGTVPLLGDMAIFAGTLAKNADLGALSKAKLMEDTGKGRDEIWKETGWFNDKGDWKFEISDALDFDTGKGADINPSSFDIIKNYGGTTKENFIGHPELYEAYPNLRDRPVRGESGSGGKYVSGTDTTFIGENLLSPNSANSLDETQSVGLHEIQHAIQNREGFQRGGNPREFKKLDGAIERDIRSFGDVLENRLNSLRNDKYYKDLSAELKEAGKNKDIDKLREISRKQNEYLNKDKIVKQYKKDLHDLYGQRGEIHLSPMDKYQRLAGEAEARLVQKRMNLTPEERRAKPPWLDLDVPEDELIYRK